MKTLKKILLLSCFFICFPAFSIWKTPPSHTTYFEQKVSDNLFLFYNESYQKQSLDLHKYTQNLNEEFKKVFPYSPYYRTNSIIFASPESQIVNGVATIFPLPRVIIYSSPVTILDFFSISNWTQDSLSHEIAHLYQINSQTKYSYGLSYFFPLFLWFVYPNIYLHDLVLEGNAVLHESIYGTGGRLFSGWARAIVFSQLKSNITLKRIFHKYNDSFSSLEKYIHGGYFYSYLLTKFSLKKVNELFSIHSKNTLIPVGFYSLNRSFKKNLGESFYSLFKKYIKHYKLQAINQKSSPEKPFLTSRIFSKLNRNNKNIFFLISDSKSSPELVTFRKKNLKWTKQKKDLPLGKVFFIEGIPYSASNYTTTPIETTFSLFDENYKALEKYKSQFVMDIVKNKTISLDVTQALTHIKLLINNKFYGHTHSSAILDDRGNVYYFKNKNKTRTLYKNKTPLWSYKGYYGFPVEADNQGVYFIASTPYGSSLFLYSNGAVSRISNSDTIIDGRKINDNQFLVAEAAPRHYEYKIITTQLQNQTPHLYKYSFQKKKINTSQIKIKQKHNPKTYSYIKNWRLENISLNISHSFKDTFKIYMQSLVTLSDLLGYNRFNVKYLIDKYKQRISLSYSNTKYRLSYKVSPLYEKGLLHMKTDKELVETLENLGFFKKQHLYIPWDLDPNIFIKKKSVPYQTRSLKFDLKLAVFDQKRWTMDLFQQFSFGEKAFNYESHWNRYIGHSGRMLIGYSKKYRYAFSHDLKFNFSTFYKAFHLQKNEKYKTFFSKGGVFLFSKDLGKEFYFSLSGLWSRDSWSRESKSIFSLSEKSAYFIHSFKHTVESINQINMNIQKTLNFSYYPNFFPLSLSRWAPLAGISFSSFKDSSLPAGYHNLLNTYLGGEFEFMANHKAKFSAGISLGFVWKWHKKLDENPRELHGGVFVKADF